MRIRAGKGKSCAVKFNPNEMHNTKKLTMKMHKTFNLKHTLPYSITNPGDKLTKQPPFGPTTSAPLDLSDKTESALCTFSM